MNLEFHHFFILVEPDAKVADRLALLGMVEGTLNKYKGQGTSNRRFNYSIRTLEFLWVPNIQENSIMDMALENLNATRNYIDETYFEVFHNCSLLWGICSREL